MLVFLTPPLSMTYDLACRNWRTDNFTYDDFKALYHYITAEDRSFYVMEWVPNITHDERVAIEEKDGMFWKNNIPGAEGYSGFTGQEPDPHHPGEFIYTNRSDQPFYYPIYVSSYDCYDVR